MLGARFVVKYWWLKFWVTAYCKIPHSSGSFDLLQREAKVEFKDYLAEIETGDIYFED